VIENGHIALAGEAINPLIATTNSVAASFGKAEGFAMYRSACETLNIDYGALMTFGIDVLSAAEDQPRRRDPQEHVEGALLGFLFGAVAARMERVQEDAAGE
jgi:hypothetical protein